MISLSEELAVMETEGPGEQRRQRQDPELPPLAGAENHD